LTYKGLLEEGTTSQRQSIGVPGMMRFAAIWQPTYFVMTLQVATWTKEGAYQLRANNAIVK